MSLRRKLSYQPDIVEWISSQKGPLKYLQKERYKMEMGFIGWFKEFMKLINMAPKTSDEVTVSPDEEALKLSKQLADRQMEQYVESSDLIKRMKWKRVTWDDDADYTSFSKRVLDNDVMFKHIPAFSFMSIHVVKDPSTSEFVNLPPAARIIEEGSLTNWVLRERDPTPVGVYPVTSTKERRSAFTVDWTAGEVRILDTASAQELLTFLSTVAPRLQALQLKMGDQQTKLTAEVENVRVRVGAAVKFNEFDTTFWDDPKRKTNPNYVNPDDVQQFLDGMLKSAFLYRWFLKGQQIRVLPPGRPYHADLEAKEIQIPANFAEYNWLKAHNRFESIEKVFNSFRRFWWVWFCFLMALVGDVELL